MPGEWKILWRKKGRAALTIGGMGCGVFALVLMASLSEHFRLLADHFKDTFGGRVYVCEKLTFWAGGGIIDEDKCDVARRVDGVGEVIPAIIGRLQPKRMVVVGLPMVLVGAPSAQTSDLWRGAPLADGRWMSAGDDGSDHALLGSDVAYAYDAHVGSQLRALDHDWTVVGVLAQTGAIEDRQMLVPLKVGQKTLDREGLITSMMVVPAAGVSAETLATRLGAALKNLEVVAPSRMETEVESSLRLWRALILACGLIAAATGTLCIVITMTVAVTERTYEVGLKKAIGASNGQIVADFLSESLLLAALGWALGTACAAGFVAAWDYAFRQEGLFLFTLTPRVIALSAAVAALFGVLAGSLPALAAARMDPVAALRRRA